MGTDGCLQSESGVAENSEGFGQSGWSGDHLCWFASFTSKDNYRRCSIGEKKDKSLLEDLDNGCVNKQAIRLRTKGINNIHCSPLLRDWLELGSSDSEQGGNAHSGTCWKCVRI